MSVIPQLVSAPLNPIPVAEHFRRSHPPCEHSRGKHIEVRKITQSKTKTLSNKLNVHATKRPAKVISCEQRPFDLHR